MKKALLIVDMQNDFCPGGTLAVKEGDKIVPVINRIMDRFDRMSTDRIGRNSVRLSYLCTQWEKITQYVQ